MCSESIKGMLVRSWNVLLVLLIALVGKGVGEESFIRNGSFETDLEGWITWGGIENIDRKIVHSGKQSIKFSSEDGADAGCYQDINLEPGDYIVRGWIKTKNLEKDSAQFAGGIQVQDPNAGRNTDINTGELLETTDWTNVSYKFTVTEDETGKRIALFFSGWGLCTGTVWFDDITILREQ